MSPIRMDAPAGEAVRRVMRKTLRSVAKELDKSRSGADVHSARRKIKLARSLLRLARKALSPEHFDQANQSLRTAARALAPLRSAEAMVEAVAKLKSELNEPKADAVFDELAAAARRLKHEVVADSDKAARVEEAAGEVAKIRKAIGKWTLPRREVSLFVAGMRSAYARARRLLREGLASGDIPLLHEARKSVIHHLHHIDALSPLWPKLFKVWKGELQDLREALGDLHDLDEMAKELDSPDGAFCLIAEKDKAGDLIATRRKQIIAAIRDETGHLFAEQPKNFAFRMLALWEHMAE